MVIPVLRSEFWVDSKSGSSVGGIVVTVGRRGNHACLSIKGLREAYVEPYHTKDGTIGMLIDGERNPSIEVIADICEFVAQVLRGQEAKGHLDFVFTDREESSQSYGLENIFLSAK